MDFPRTPLLFFSASRETKDFECMRWILLLTVYTSLLLLIFFSHNFVPRAGFMDVEYTKEDLDDLIEKSKRFIQKYNFTEWKAETRATTDEYSITVVTAKRDQAYLFKVVEALLQAHKNSFKPRISLCNTDLENNTQLDPFRGVFAIVNLHQDVIVPPSRSSINDRISKESQDYWKCLSMSLYASANKRARYVLLLEDDAVVHGKLPMMMSSVTRQLEGRAADVDYVKMYHPRQWRYIPAYPLAISASLLTSIVVNSLIVNTKVYFWRWNIIGAVVLSICIVYQGIFLISDVRFLLTGGSVYLSRAESCCTPAVLFRTTSIPQMTKELSQEVAKNGHAKDHILDESRFISRATDINVVQHIGRVSSLLRNHP